MTYKEVITLLGRELLDKRAWPDDATKLVEQLDLLYAAGLAVGSLLPLSRFTLISAALQDNGVTESPLSYDLPDDLFTYRDDLGIQRYKFDGKTFYPHQSSAYERVQMMANNSLHEYTLAFITDTQAHKLYLSSLCDVSMHYLPLFTKPKEQDNATNDDPAFYERMDYPLKDNDARRAIHLVAAHKSGVTIRDNAMAVFHNMLAETYANVRREA